jgi:enoyl-CoA hydratase/carnithine racemase
MKRLLLLGERIDSRQALAAGILTHVVGETQTLAAAKEIARVACSFVPRALVETKHLLVALADGASDLTVWERIRMELLASPERQSALAAAKAKLRA